MRNAARRAGSSAIRKTSLTGHLLYRYCRLARKSLEITVTFYRTR